MKLKYVLFSGLLLSVGFTACTNEDFTEVTAPVNTSEAIALGEGYTITVNNGAATRAALDDKYAPYWEEGDKLGAAWAHKVTKYDEDTYEVSDCSLIGSSYKGFYSNHPFTLIDGVNNAEGIFKLAEGNAMAGAYVLYYPYDETIDTQSDALPVSIKEYKVDCADQLGSVNENMFAYSPVKFVPGGNQTADFFLKQVPVFFELKFTPDNVFNNDLVGNVTIQNIVVEASKGGSTVLTKLGEIKTKTAPNKDNYNKNTLSDIVKYEANMTADYAADHLFITVEGGDNADYQLIKNEQTTNKSFIFSILPFSEKADKVVIKIVTDKGVFKKEYTSADKNEDGKSYLDEFNNAAVEGGQVAVNVWLDTSENDGSVIYNETYFKEAWSKIKAGEEVILNLGEELDLSDTDLNLAVNAKKVTIKGAPLTVKSLTATNGNLVIENEVTVEGDAEIGSNSKGFTTGTNGQLSVDGDLTIEGGEVGNISFTLAKAASLQVDASGIAEITGIKNTKGELATELGSITNEGELTLNKIAIAEDEKVDNTGTLTVGVEVENNGTINQNGEFVMEADFTNKGEFNINDTMNGNNKTFTNAAGATLNINYELGTQVSKLTITNEAATDKADAAVININEDVDINTTNKLTNKGVINVNAGTLAEGNGAIVQTEADAEINVAADATLTLNSTSGVIGGNIVPDAEANINNAGNAPISATVTSSTKLEDLNKDVNTYIMSGSFTFDEDNWSDYSNKKLVFTGGTITLKGSATRKEFATTEAVEFTGDTTLKNGAEDLTDEDNKVTFKLGEDAVVSAGTLTVGNAVVLNLNSKTLSVDLSNKASLVKAEAYESEDGEILAGEINGDPDYKN